MHVAIRSNVAAARSTRLVYPAGQQRTGSAPNTKERNRVAGLLVRLWRSCAVAGEIDNLAAICAALRP
jgi:hypothetical protein